MPPQHYHSNGSRRLKKLRSENPAEDKNLCSIPEDASPKLSSFFDQEEPICHRSPVTLANGYKPCYSGSKNPDSGNPVPGIRNLINEQEYSSEAEEEADFEDDNRKMPVLLSVWRFLALITYIVRFLLMILCLSALFVIFVIFTHGDQLG